MKKFAQSNFLDVLLLLLIIFGIILRFTGMQWNAGANLHPDEYGLTNTLTQLSFPQTINKYFNTRISPISPYNKYDSSGVFLQDGADNRMRWGQWPIILLRGMAELTQNTGYDELRMMGRYFSAFVDTLTLLLVFLIGGRLYGMRVGLLGAGLSSLAVLQIQQSHFMTADNFTVFFQRLRCTQRFALQKHRILSGHTRRIINPIRPTASIVQLLLLTFFLESLWGWLWRPKLTCFLCREWC